MKEQHPRRISQMQTLIDPGAALDSRTADPSVDPAELIFDDIMSQPPARRLDRAPGAEAVPNGFQNPEAVFILSYNAYFFGKGGGG
jgi:hypothetical protein